MDRLLNEVLLAEIVCVNLYAEPMKMGKRY